MSSVPLSTVDELTRALEQQIQFTDGVQAEYDKLRAEYLHQRAQLLLVCEHKEMLQAWVRDLQHYEQLHQSQQAIIEAQNVLIAELRASGGRLPHETD